MSEAAYTNFKIFNLSLVSANTEYSQALSTNAAYFEVKCRSLSDMKLALNPGESGTLYISIPTGAAFSSRGRIFGTKTLYLQSPSGGVIAEISQWS